MEQLALIIKVQATIRGYLTRKKIRVAQMNMGIYQYDPNAEVADDYDNPKVQVSPPPNPTISLQLPFFDWEFKGFVAIIIYFWGFALCEEQIWY